MPLQIIPDACYHGKNAEVAELADALRSGRSSLKEYGFDSHLRQIKKRGEKPLFDLFQTCPPSFIVVILWGIYIAQNAICFDRDVVNIGFVLGDKIT